MEILCQLSLDLVGPYHGVSLLHGLQKWYCIESVWLRTMSRNQGDSIFGDKYIVFGEYGHTIIVAQLSNRYQGSCLKGVQMCPVCALMLICGDSGSVALWVAHIVSPLAAATSGPDWVC